MKYIKIKSGLLMLWLISMFKGKSRIRMILLGVAAFISLSAVSCDGGPFVSCYDPVDPNAPVDTTQTQPDSTKSVNPPTSPDSICLDK